ncbi:HAD family hydrolase [Edaphobacter sp. 12200R-103]|uniref:HAD family hydrolase n=1 Tax=Edaphobacter sp. 12200R-103 TaxID=2703788 RepID=UPI00138C0345|nr:HAD family hydrolase [Edaphobacter sp. 12200R-103]QHS52070.1 HAD family hydrolase [Edaphobacter sp. 12200R-103]
MSEVVRVETKGLLFDMDGVLISSIGSVVRCWRIWAKQYGVPDADSYEVPHGMRAIDIVRSLRPDIDPLEGLRAIEDLEIEDTADLTVLPGAKELLQSLPPERWAIVTSATRRLMLGRLEAAGLPAPERIVSADDVVRGKPDPEPYRKGAELLGCTPEECIVVEDAPSGVGAGKAAGSRVLGVVGTHTLAQLEQADWVVNSLERVTAKIGKGGLELSFIAEKR